MSQQSHLPEEPRPDGEPAAAAGGTYEVGYGKPPKRTQFKPGQSGNPKGKQKGRLNVRTVVEKTLNQRITIHEGERSRLLTKLEAMVLRVMNDALKGDQKSLAAVIQMMRSVGMTDEVPEPNVRKPFTAHDDDIIADFLSRQGFKTQQHDTPEPASAPTETSPIDRSAKS